MNEEEKQAIEKVFNFAKFTIDEYGKKEDNKYLKIVRNLISKQQKEIKELSIIKNSIQALETHFVNDDTYYVIAKENFLEGDFRHLLDDYISKDKIKEKIKYYHKQREKAETEKINDMFVNYIDCLKELLGE